MANDAIEKLEAEVERVATHLGLERSSEEITAVAKRCGFEPMRAEADDRDAKAAAEGGFVKKQHLREGRAGAWRDVMSPEMASCFDAKSSALIAACSGLSIEDVDKG